MKLHEINIARKRDRLRVGRGIGSGHGKTAGRGTKGQRSRTGVNLKPTFEGGQNPLIHRIPKLHGFTSKRPKFQIVHTDSLNQFSSDKPITSEVLAKVGLIRSADKPVKILSRGGVEKKLTLEIVSISQAARRNIEAKGGNIKLTK